MSDELRLFNPDVEQDRWIALVSRVVLAPWQVALVRGPLDALKAGPTGDPDNPDILPITEYAEYFANQRSQMHRTMFAKLCWSKDDEIYVESLIALVEASRLKRPGQPIQMTRHQIRQVARLRFGFVWADSEFEGLQQQFIGRPAMRANRFELMVETRRGTYAGGHRAVVPSEYRTTGIEKLLKPDARLEGLCKPSSQANAATGRTRVHNAQPLRHGLRSRLTSLRQNSSPTWDRSG